VHLLLLLMVGVLLLLLEGAVVRSAVVAHRLLV
jgi:hypothetical protein